MRKLKDTKDLAMIFAVYVRHAIEDIHKHISPDNNIMCELNTRVRNAIYTALVDQEDNPQHLMNAALVIPSYWEAPEYLFDHQHEEGERRKPAPVKLFWVRDEEDSENWFVFSRNWITAQRFFEEHEGMERGYARAIPVTVNPKLCSEIGNGRIDEVIRDIRTPVPKRSAHAQIEDLRILGFEVIDDGKTSSNRVVSFGGRVYSEGKMESKMQQKIKRVKPGSGN